MNLKFIRELLHDIKYEEKIEGIKNLPNELIEMIFEYVLPTRNRYIQGMLKNHIWLLSFRTRR